MGNDFCLDKTPGYKVKIETANTRHRFPNLKSCYEFSTVEEVASFLQKELGTSDRLLTQRDSEKDHGMLSCTSWYTVIKKYRDVPDCMLY